ncbi:MAG: hypothetical protein IJU72_02370 [Bacteroidales bacterium]|nr:hypothetical protein [Bacteroidales bacterium]
MRTSTIAHTVLAMLLLAMPLKGTAQQPSLPEQELRLRTLLDSMAHHPSYSGRDSLNATFLRLFEQAIRQPSAFEHPFDSLTHMGRLRSDDGRVRLFTWNIPQADGSQRFFGFVLHRPSKRGPHTTTALHDRADSIARELQTKAQLTASSWFGALYYQIVTVPHKSRPHYLLLGYRPSGLFVARKVVDPLTFSASGAPVFGLPVFEVDGKQQLQRIVFEFSARASMLLRYEPKQHLLVFDHLSPSAPRLAGNPQFYGPDFSYDGFRLDKATWRYVRDLDMRNPASPHRGARPSSDPPFVYERNYKR